MVVFFLLSASSAGKPKTSLKRSFRNVYCPLFIIQPTLFATSTAVAFLPMGGREFALLNVGSLSTRFRYDARSVTCAGNEPNEPVGSDLTKLCRAGGSDLFGVAVVGVEREKPTFMAALRISIFSRVRLTSSGFVVEVIVLVELWDLLLPCEYVDSVDVVLDHRAVAARLPSVPRTRMLGIFGELSSGEIGVSSNSVVGVSG